tara:strand:- start:269 stop:655 length:387 start_codon:yes stop_codon:yes gene_type:complete
MKIYGLGTDIVNCNRIKKTFSNNLSLLNRVFSKSEIEYCKEKKNPHFCYAMRFAAKEAFSKSLGTGISKGISLKEIVVGKKSSGQPYLSIKGSSLKIMNKIFKRKKFHLFLSISDDKPFAIATVIIAF